MLFHTPVFALFFACVYTAYLLFNFFGGRFRLKLQNALLLAASYGFYGAWDWRFLFLLALSTGVDFICGLRIHKAADDAARKRWLWLSLAVNLGFLGIFKYAGFFAANLQVLFGLCGIKLSLHMLSIVLPVGISFYTFQSMSYTIDIYRRQMEPTRNLLDFALFVSFFPQLVAGPIERAARFLPQISAERKLVFKRVCEGAHLFFLGLFMKMYIGDNLGVFADRIFSMRGPFTAGQVLLGAYAFTFQIYGDFAGYTHMARGLARMMGFDLMLNFRNPYLSVNPREFWRRWHISLSTWLRDYLYIPLGGSRAGKFKTCRNLVITMFLGGLWHGAAWHFILWGLFYGVLLSAYRFLLPALTRTREFFERLGPWAVRGWFMVCLLCFFQFTVFGRVLFRVETTGQLFSMFRALWQWRGLYGAAGDFIAMAPYVAPVLIIDVIHYRRDDDLALMKLPFSLRWLFYVVAFYLLIFSGSGNADAFIYFQF